jgi:sugar phosphate isomerase/epimerase
MGRSGREPGVPTPAGVSVLRPDDVRPAPPTSPVDAAAVGRGRAERALTELAEHLGAPVITTALGKRAIREDHDLYLGTLSLWSPWIAEGPIANLVATAERSSWWGPA